MKRATNLRKARRLTFDAVPFSRCDICAGEGLLELVPVGKGRWACPCCRYRLDMQKALAEAEK